MHVHPCGPVICDESGMYAVILRLECWRLSSIQVCLGVQVRRKLVGKTEPCYSQYTCYTGIADFTPPDIDTVGYRVFLGNGQYFVSSDVGGGKMQWCAAQEAFQAGRGRVAVRNVSIALGCWCT